MPQTTRTRLLPHAPTTVFDWHARPGAFERLTPPWEDVRMVSRTGGLEAGARIELSMPLIGPLRTAWKGEHTACVRPDGFTDVQRQGPFAAWTHEHRFAADGTGTRLEDHITWKAPLGPLGALAHPMIRRRLEQTFRWRQERTERDLRRHAEADLTPMRIAMTGATGLVGRSLTAFLQTGGHEVVPLTRHRDRPGIFWDPLGGEVGPGLEDVDAVIHLAGAPIAERPWTPDVKRSIRDSRVLGTRTLAEALARLPPKVLISTGAVGYYGDRGDEVLSEESSRGTGFLADVVEAWEAAVEPARSAGWRVATVRVGLVLSAGGGVLGPLLPLFRLGMGGPLGSGDQWMSWVHLDDLVALFHWLLTGEQEGVFNGVSPNPVQNRTFSRALGRALWRPAFAPAPSSVVRWMLGREKADELVFSSQRVLPTRASAGGFHFDEPRLEGALRWELGS